MAAVLPANALFANVNPRLPVFWALVLGEALPSNAIVSACVVLIVTTAVNPPGTFTGVTLPLATKFSPLVPLKESPASDAEIVLAMLPSFIQDSLNVLEA